NLWNREKESGENVVLAKASEVKGRYYLRVVVEDRAGVISEVTAILANAGISISSCVQDECDEASGIPLIIMTHETTEGAVLGAIEEMKQIACVKSEPVRMRIYG
nr:ACT domain-containing protein [Thermoguttaceae bacterium]